MEAIKGSINWWDYNYVRNVANLSFSFLWFKLQNGPLEIMFIYSKKKRYIGLSFHYCYMKYWFVLQTLKHYTLHYLYTVNLSLEKESMFMYAHTHTKKKTIQILKRYDIDRSRRLKWNNKGTKRQLPCDLIQMWNLKGWSHGSWK